MAFEAKSSKKFRLEEVDWDDILKVEKLSELLRDTTHLKFPDGTIMFTIEVLVDLPDEYLTGVLETYGLDNFQGSLEETIDLLWFFYVTGALVIVSEEEASLLSGFFVTELQKYLKSKCDYL